MRAENLSREPELNYQNFCKKEQTYLSKNTSYSFLEFNFFRMDNFGDSAARLVNEVNASFHTTEKNVKITFDNLLSHHLVHL